jgi:septum formation protein
MGINFETRTKETDESYPEILPVEEVALFIANKKAVDLADTSKDDEIIICADTTVIIDDKLLGKPFDREDAVEMLSTLSGREHQVVTGVVIVSKEKEIRFSVTTRVFFHPLSKDDIDFYIDTFNPFDKAGAYGIQEWIGYTAIQKIEGSYNNVVGLPTHEVYQALKQFDIA